VRVLITGFTGQDGPYLARHLITAGHDVYGMVHGQERRRWRHAQQFAHGTRLVRGDLLDQSSLHHVVRTVRPDLVYNLGALSFVGTSWLQPEAVAQVTGLGCLRLLDAIRFERPGARFVQASSSEMFGDAPQGLPQNERTPFAPRSPYAFAKVLAHQATVNYRESYDMHASTAIMFNHESPRRGREFVTRKISRAVAKIKTGKQQVLCLGRLDPQRDWGHAEEYMEALPLITALDEPGDFVLATGETHSVAEFAEAAFAVADLVWQDHVMQDPDLFRPAEVNYLRGDPSRAKRALGWEAATGLEGIATEMVTADLQRVKR
jgi:GDPmannose 4,6-dehydratase